MTTGSLCSRSGNISFLIVISVLSHARLRTFFQVPCRVCANSAVHCRYRNSEPSPAANRATSARCVIPSYVPPGKLASPGTPCARQSRGAQTGPSWTRFSLCHLVITWQRSQAERLSSRLVLSCLVFAQHAIVLSSVDSPPSHIGNTQHIFRLPNTCWSCGRAGNGRLRAAAPTCCLAAAQFAIAE